MNRRVLFGAGLSIGALLAVLARWATLPRSDADESSRDVRLVVSCDDETRPKVLEALSALPVDVHDLRTMQRVGPARPIELPLPLDARSILQGIVGVLDEARKSTGDAIVLRGFEADRTRVRISIAVADVAAIDAVRIALERAPALRIKALDPGTVATSGGLFASDFSMRFHPAAEGETWIVSERPSLEATRDAFRPLAFTEVSAEFAYPVRSGTVRGRKMEGKATSLDEVLAAVERLGRIPGIRVTGVAWRLSEKGVATPFRLELSARGEGGATPR